MAGWAAGANRQSRRWRRAASEGPERRGGLRRSRSCGTPRRDYREATPTPPNRCRRPTPPAKRGRPHVRRNAGPSVSRASPAWAETRSGSVALWRH